MPEVIQWVEDTTRAYGLGRARNVPRQRVRFARGWLHVLPAGDMDLGVLGLKSYTSFREGNRFLVTLYSAENGQLLALVEANYLGMMRTGAMSALATKYLARPDADTMAIIGTGWQARGQVLALAAQRPLRQIRVYGLEKQEEFAEEMARLTGVETMVCGSAQEAVGESLIVSTATTSVDPVLQREAVKPGTHLNAVGSNALHRRELEDKLVGRASLVVVDSRAQARQESGDLLSPTERGWMEWDLLPELSDVIVGRIPGRQGAEDITIFESHGLGLQDVAVATHLYRKAREAGVGEEVKLLEP
jgi:ornithine cyclodeaminase/alanine dehydrogenase-like protein (mu-crystallin family)